MTFDEAFNAAEDRLGNVTVCGEAPKASVRVKALAACRDRCRESMRDRGRLPTRWQLRSAANKAVGFGPLTWLWIAVMVGRLLLILRELLNRETQHA